VVDVIPCKYRHRERVRRSFEISRSITNLFKLIISTFLLPVDVLSTYKYTNPDIPRTMLVLYQNVFTFKILLFGTKQCHSHHPNKQTMGAGTFSIEKFALLVPLPSGTVTGGRTNRQADRHEGKESTVSLSNKWKAPVFWKYVMVESKVGR
jgi:hypothetical protein